MYLLKYWEKVVILPYSKKAWNDKGVGTYSKSNAPHVKVTANESICFEFASRPTIFTHKFTKVQKRYR